MCCPRRSGWGPGHGTAAPPVGLKMGTAPACVDRALRASAHKASHRNAWEGRPTSPPPEIPTVLRWRGTRQFAPPSARALADCPDCQRNPSGAWPGQCDGYRHPRDYHYYARTETAILAACPLLVLGGARYTHRLLFHSTPIEDNLPPSLPGRLINPSVHLPRLVLGTYILPVPLVLRRSASALAASHFTHRAGVGRHSNPIQFFFLSLSDLRPTKAGFAQTQDLPSSACTGEALHQQPVLTFTYLPSLVLTNHPIVSFDSPPLTCLSLLKAALTQQSTPLELLLRTLPYRLLPPCPRR